ncbi:histidine--tRNA ligase [Phyllobacterium leguminum]|uniref:Histidine--tRNA ligase n=1 Tax=Phyllobacterium leguminum TaxID=314237 RepID=A0A318T5M6_9HYPH|nr:histidine--tRNA ligase [Phyllobacterium leguminum]PYE90398.1 histidyl-tRNA synthetase [Phyllobacterium leguminum]
MANKADKVKARLPRGLVDRHASDIRATDKMLAAIREVYERYGFDPVETPMLEYTDALGKFLPDQDRPNEGVFSLQDDDEQWLSLRYDLTAPLARHVAENFNEIQLPYRTYRAGYVFRNEKPGPGRFRQFMQFDADTVGAPSVAADAEMCMMMADVMEAVGIKRGEYVVRVNNRKVLDGVMEAIGVTEEGQKLTILRAIDKLDKFGLEGVKLLLGAGRKDESGDFTKGAGLNERQIDKVLILFKIEDFAAEARASNSHYTEGVESGIIDARKAEDIRTKGIFGGLLHNLVGSARGLEGATELQQIWDMVVAGGYDDGRIRIDPSVVRGLEYYTGPVFEVELTAQIPNEKGEIVRFGSVGGGGRYDGLVSRFRGQPVPATGFSIGVSRLMTALKNLGKLGEGDVLAPVLVTVMDGDMEAMGKYQDFTQKLRAAGIRAEMYQGNWKKFGNQLKYADRRGAPLAIIQGADERANAQVQIKDLIEGKRLSEEIESNEEWRSSRPAQVTVKEEDLVAAVKRMLDEQAADRAVGA